MSEKFAYMAGLMDGEGSWSIQVNIRESKGVEHVHFNPRMTMGLKFGNEVLDRFVDEFGGAIYDYDSGMRKWSMGSRQELIYATKCLLPYLTIKRVIAERFLEAMEVFPIKRAKHYKGERSWTPEMTEKVARIALTLNPGGSGRSQKTLEYLNKLHSVYGVDSNVDAIIKSTQEEQRDIEG